MEAFDWDGVITELSKPGGWIKGEIGAFSAREGGVCLLGAMRRVDRLSPIGREALHPAMEAARSVINEQFPERTSRELTWEVPPFNDHPDTTLDDVILVCEKARAHGGVA